MEMADVTIHIDENLTEEHLNRVSDAVRAHDGVMAVAHREGKRHLIIIEYDPDQVTSAGLLEAVKAQGVHAELIGL
jgi:hypothetical protein